MNARVSLSQAAYVASWLSRVVTTVDGPRNTHRALHAHVSCTEERSCDLDGIVNLPAFGVRIWVKDHPTFSIRSRAQSRRPFRHSARKERKVR